MNTQTIQQQLLLNTILHGNCIEKMRDLPANSVDFILTDPPYLVNYHDRDGRSIQNDAKDDWLRPAMREAISDIERFLWPLLTATAIGTSERLTWPANGPWT